MKLLLLVCAAALGLGPTARAFDPAPAQALLKRVVPRHASEFVIETIPAADGRDVFELESRAGKVVLRGNSPLSIASALGYYLKHQAKCHLSFCGDQMALPDPLPPVAGVIRVVCPFQDRVFFNYCTLSYSGAWWDWADWERVTDFLALNGINRPLLVAGLEQVWVETLREHGFSEPEARAFLTGPAFAAWQWMTNIQSHGGPLPAAWVSARAELGKRLVARQRELGMEPVLQGFSGNVPREMKGKFPAAAIALQPSWCSFPGSAQLDPLDPLFARVSDTFYRKLRDEYGPLRYLAADPFHESAPPRPGADYLTAVGKAIHARMKAAAPESVWVMQAWSIRREIATAVPLGDLLVLDLNGSRWRSSENFWGHRFVTGVLHNFGGRINLHGDLRQLAGHPFLAAAKAAPNATGCGFFMEGIVQNPVYYDLALELVWRDQPVAIDPWLDAYARRRYGAASANAEAAWRLLLAGPYRPGTSGTENSSMPAARPALDPRKSGPNAGFAIPYDPVELARAWELLLADAPVLAGSDAWRFDVVDVGRQVLSNAAQPLQRRIAAAFAARDGAAFRAAVAEFDGLLGDLDRLLGTRPEYHLGHWLAAARRHGSTAAERDQFERNQAMLVTWWGPEPGGSDQAASIFDYGWREWSGLVGGYYRGRWRLFHEHLAGLLESGGTWTEAGLPEAYGRPALRANAFYARLADWEWQWISSRHDLPAEPQGDAAALATGLAAKYVPLTRTLEFRASPPSVALPKGAVKIGGWQAGRFSPQWQTATWEVTSALTAAGDFTVVFQFTGGGHRLHVRKVELVFGDQPVAADAHEGRTGNEHVGNSWRLKVPEPPLNTPLKVRAEVRTDGGNDSNGMIYLLPAK